MRGETLPGGESGTELAVAVSRGDAVGRSTGSVERDVDEVDALVARHVEVCEGSEDHAVQAAGEQHCYTRW